MNINLAKCSPIAVLNGLVGIKRRMVKDSKRGLPNEEL